MKLQDFIGADDIDPFVTASLEVNGEADVAKGRLRRGRFQ